MLQNNKQIIIIFYLEKNLYKKKSVDQKVSKNIHNFFKHIKLIKFLIFQKLHLELIFIKML